MLVRCKNARTAAELPATLFSSFVLRKVNNYLLYFL